MEYESDLMQNIRALLEQSASTAYEQKRRVSTRSFISEFNGRPTRSELKEWYAARLNDIDATLNTMESIHSLACSCSRGCSHCCQHPVLISQFEAIVILEYLGQGKQRYSALRTASAAVRTIKAERMDSRSTARMNQKTFVEKCFELAIPCPLLAGDGSCGVYPVRPIECAFYRNYGPPERCDDTPTVLTAATFNDWKACLRVEIQEIGKQLGLSFCDPVDVDHLAMMLQKADRG